jgi:UDP-N-acetylmuramate dehydrogenase
VERGSAEGKLRIERGVFLASLTSLGVGGCALALARVHTPEEVAPLLEWARGEKLPRFVLGSGTNVLVPDAGLSGLVLKIEIDGLETHADEIVAGAGEELGGVIRAANSLGLGGMERMFGIPGTVGGAVIGNAGAYGQEIGDAVVEAEIWEDGRLRTVTANDLRFSYRWSRFKERRDWLLLRCRFRLSRSVGDLQAASDEILRQRLAKYPQGLRCPGSYFRNVPVSAIPPDVQRALPDGAVVYGKVPAGRLLEAVGAKGMVRGGAKIAEHHANLLFNAGGATAAEITALAEEVAARVEARFGIRLEPEVVTATAG